MAITNLTLLVFGSALANLAVDGEQLRQTGVEVITVEPSSSPEFPIDEIDCVLFDGTGDGRWGVEQIKHLHLLRPQCKILVSMPNSILSAVDLLQAGAVGLLKQSQTAEQFVSILNRLQSGHFYLDQDIAQQLAIRQIKRLLAPFNQLTSREFDVFCLLAEGFSLQSMAEQLCVSSKTVSNCKSQIKSKLGIESREAMHEFAKIHGLID